MNKVKDAGGGKKDAPGVAGRKKAFENPVDKKKTDKSADLKKMDKLTTDKKLAEKPAGKKHSEKPTTGNKSAENPADKKSAETSAGKKSADKPTDVKKGAGKPTDKKGAEKPTNVKKSLDNSTNKKSAEKSSEKKPAVKVVDKNNVDKLADKKSAEKSADKKSAGKLPDKKTVEKPADKKKAEKTDKKSAEKPEEAQIIMEDVDSDEEPQSYNKIKFHSSKMDLGLRILREEMAHLQDSGNSLSRQIASMYRTFEEMKDEEMKAKDEGANEDDGDACSDYDQYSNDDVDSQCADTRDDDLDTEDDVNLMSDLETDSSARSLGAKRKRPLKRPPPIQLQEGQQQQSGGSEKDPANGNQIRTGSEFSLPIDSTDDGEQDANSDFYPDFETSDSDECSHCLCCSSLASYSSGIPWKYVDKSASSAPEYDSDSSEYYSDSDDAPLESPAPIYKRLSPFFYQECYAEVEDEVPLSPGPDGEKVIRSGIVDDEEFPEKRMSPLGCESPRQASSRTSSGPELDELDDHDDKGQGKDKKAKVSKHKNAAVKSKESRKDSNKEIPKSEPLVRGKVLPVVEKDKDIVAKSKKGTKADLPKSEPIKSNKPNKKAMPKTADVSAAATATDDDDDEPEEPVNVKDRIKNFEVTNKQSDTGTFKNKSKPKPLQDQDGEVDEAMDKAKQAVLSELRGNIKDSKGNPKVKPSAKAPPVKSKPPKVAKEQVSGKPPRHVSKSTFQMKIADDGEHVKRHGSHGSPKIRRSPGQTIEIPVQYLNNRIPTPEGGQVDYTQPDALTFQVRPVAGNMQGPPGGPFIITTSPKVRRKVSKQVLQLADPDDISEQTTLRPEPQGGVPTPTSESSAGAGEHHMCPHCHKKAVPHEERQRNVQVLQLQPVDENQLPPPTPATPTPQTTITFEAPPPQQDVRPGRIIKVIPSGRQQMFMQRQPSEEPRSVHFRLNMPVGGQTHGVPIQVGDYIRIPLNRTQARGVRVIFN